jgi:formylglycine-generating enzyme required for sulfatase activity
MKTPAYVILAFVILVLGGVAYWRYAASEQSRPANNAAPPAAPEKEIVFFPWAKPETIAQYAQRLGLKPAETLDLGNGISLELALVPAGKFTLGSWEHERLRGADEGPEHEVTFVRAFYVARYEVTQEQYQAVMGANPSAAQGAKFPVEQVTWDEAQEFCRKASARTGKTVRLPTEAEWEHACRAGTESRYSFGNDESGLDDAAWYWNNSFKQTHAVGERKPNAWGLYDMHGNVWEWCQDFYGEYSAQSVRDPQGPAEGKYRVLRGGSWYTLAPFCRSAFRFYSLPTVRLGYVGFRVVATPVSLAR